MVHGIDSLPASLEDALIAMQADPLMMEALGEHVTKQYIEGKMREWDEYRTHVTNWEVEKYMVIY
jgi:glutamine synthetase